MLVLTNLIILTHSFLKIQAKNTIEILELKVDNDGNIICPICDEKLPSDSNWEQHVEEERKNLIKSIER